MKKLYIYKFKDEYCYVYVWISPKKLHLLKDRETLAQPDLHVSFTMNFIKFINLTKLRVRVPLNRITQVEVTKEIWETLKSKKYEY
jgi:hypothetical protein